MIALDDKYRLEDFGYRAYLEHDHESVPTIRRKTMTIPGMPGEWDFGSEVGARQFNIPMRVSDHDQINLQQKQSKFISFLFNEFGVPRPIKISFDYEPDKHYIVKVASAVTPSTAIYHFRNFGLPLVASDPMKYSNVYADEITWGSEVVTFEFNYLLGREGLDGSVKVTSQQTLNIPVDGMAVQPIFEMSGSANNLTISANGYSFTIPIVIDNSLIIDFEKYVAFRNGIETMIEMRDFYLLPGNNAVKITGSNINLDLRIKFRDKYM